MVWKVTSLFAPAGISVPLFVRVRTVAQMVSLIQRKIHEITASPFLAFLRGVAIFVIAGYIAWTASRILLFGSALFMPVLGEVIFLVAIFLPAGIVASAIGRLFCASTSLRSVALGNALSGAVFGGTALLMRSVENYVVVGQPCNRLAMFAASFLACCLVYPAIALPFLSRRTIVLYYVTPAAFLVCCVGWYRYRDVVPEASGRIHTEAGPVDAVNLVTGSTERITFKGMMTIVEFWATTCIPCQDSMQSLNTFAAINRRKYNGKLQVVTVSLDRDRNAAKKYMKMRQWTESHALIDKPASTDDTLLFPFALARRFGVESIPHCLLIDGRGQIVFRGHPMYLDLDAVVSQIHE